MNPRKLSQRITIYKNSEGRDEYGDPIDEKVEVLRCWASVRNKSGNEYFKTNTPYSKTITSFLIRYRKDIKINTNMFVEFKDEEYNIVYVDNYNFGNRWLEIIAEKVI